MHAVTVVHELSNRGRNSDSEENSVVKPSFLTSLDSRWKDRIDLASQSHPGFGPNLLMSLANIVPKSMLLTGIDHGKTRISYTQASTEPETV